MSDPAEVGKDLDAALAARRYKLTRTSLLIYGDRPRAPITSPKRDDDKYRCQAAGAERWVSEADDHLTKRNSALLAAHVVHPMLRRSVCAAPIVMLDIASMAFCAGPWFPRGGPKSRADASSLGKPQSAPRYPPTPRRQREA